MMTQFSLTAYMQIQAFSFNVVLSVGCEHFNEEK